MKRKYILRSAACICTTFLIVNTGLAQDHLELIDSGLRNLNIIERQLEERKGKRGAGESIRQDKQYMRWKMDMESHLNAKGEIFNFAAHNYEELRKFQRSQPLKQGQRATHGEWENITPPDFSPPNPANGRLNCIAIHPNNSDIIYVGAAIGGLWVTYDGGSTWSSLTDGMPTLGVSGIVIHHNNPDIIYILTGDGDGRNVPSMGVFKSSNGGLDWVSTNLQFDRNELVWGYKLLMHPSNPNIMYAGVSGGLYKTTNGWSSQTKVLSKTVRDVEFAPGDPDVLYASTGINVFYKSADAGATWDNINATNSGLPDSSHHFQRMAIAVNPGYSFRVYVAYGKAVNQDTFGYYEVYYSSNYGESFSLMSSSYDVVGNQNGYNFDLIAEPNNSGVLYFGAVPLLKSTDHGGSFSAIPSSGPGVHADVHRILWHGSTLYALTDGGIAKSTDGGQTFSDITGGIRIMQFYDIDVLGVDVMGGTQDNGTNRWDLGDPVGDHIKGGDGFESIYDPDGERIYYCTQDERFRLTFPNDEDNITPPGHANQWDASWIMHPTDHDTLYCADNTLAISFDRGDTWNITNPLFDKIIRALAQGINQPDTMYASDRLEIKRSNNINDPSPGWINVTGDWDLGNGASLGGIAVDPDDASRVWVTFRGYRDTLKVMFSETAGQFGSTPWQNVTDNLPNIPVHCIAYEPGSNDGIYLGTDLGVFYRNANMNDWIWFSNGLPMTRIEDLKISGSYLYAGTYGRGMWRTTLYSTCPLSISLTQANDPHESGNTGTVFYSAEHSISSDRIIDGGFGTNVTYSAGNYIRLDPGFHARATNVFQADMSGCPD